MGHFTGLNLVFGGFGHSHLAIIGTLSFGPWSKKLGGTVQAIIKMTQNDNRPGPPGITEKQPVLHLAEMCFFGQKSVFSPKNTQIC